MKVWLTFLAVMLGLALAGAADLDELPKIGADFATILASRR